MTSFCDCRRKKLSFFHKFVADAEAYKTCQIQKLLINLYPN